MNSALPQKLPDDPVALENVIARRERAHYPLKQGAQANIVWQGEDRKAKTEYAIVYLHGFKSSHGEGTPVHTRIANKFGCNLYLSRLYGHGQITLNRLGDITPAKLVQSAVDACRIGQKIGEKVILMGTSTGASLALHLAASSTDTGPVSALILYSPLVHLYGIQSLLLENAFSRKLLQFYPGKNYLVRYADPFSPGGQHIWYRSYKLNGVLVLGETIQQHMTPATFNKISRPTFIGYYYKDKHKHDRVVSTSAIKRMAKQLGTPPQNILIKNFSNANSHVICSSLLSDAVQDVITSTEHFLLENLGLKPVQ